METVEDSAETDRERNNTTLRRESASECNSAGAWGGVDFTDTESDVYPPAWLSREQWMCHQNKHPFAPWGDRDHPDADPEDDARYKWSLSDNYITGSEMARFDSHQPTDGRVYIQQEEDPFGFVDGDHVRDPETEEVHPVFVAILEHLGLTYADVSTSETGVHALYRCPEGLPLDGQAQTFFDLDTEPWGANEEAPSIEIYTNRRACVVTGNHVADTPTEITEWNDDALLSVLKANICVNSTQSDSDTGRDSADIVNYTPQITSANETTEEIHDLFYAVDQLQPQDLPIKSSQVGIDSTGWEKWNPNTYRQSTGGDSLHTKNREVFYDHKTNEAFGTLKLFALEQGILSRSDEPLEKEKWWEAVEKARQAGAQIPVYAGGEESVGVLLPAESGLTTVTGGWDWKHAAQQDDTTLDVSEARSRTTSAIAEAYRHSSSALIEALPTMGKSYGAVKAADETGKQVTILTGRGHNEQYGQFQKWCDKFDLDYYTLPSFNRDCSTANGTHGENLAHTVSGWYQRGATPKKIHKTAGYVLDDQLPCQDDDAQTCPYTSKWDFDPDEFDVLIGHYSHAHNLKIILNRAVVFDEFTEAYETILGPELQPALSYWLETTDGVPFKNYTDLIGNRDDQARCKEALLWFENNNIQKDEKHVFDDNNAHAAAPIAVYTLLTSEDLGNGFEYAEIGDVGVGVFNRSASRISILQPPSLKYTSNTVALDGTPTEQLWKLAVDTQFSHWPVLDDEERSEYIHDALNLNLVPTTEYTKPYNPSPERAGDRIAVNKDAALLDAIVEKHDQLPALITTRIALKQYDDAGMIDIDFTATSGNPVTGGPVDSVKWYGDVLGSNEFDQTRLGVVIGSNHYGDAFIKKWGAYAGQAVERNDEKGSELSYGEFGDKILTHMREHDTLQAVMRFGRDGNGAVVYVHTNTLPEWVPLAGTGQIITTWSDGMKSVIRAVKELGEATTSSIVEHKSVNITRQQVHNHLKTLSERDILDCKQDDMDGRRFLWHDDGLCQLSDYGDADLDSVELANSNEEP